MILNIHKDNIEDAFPASEISKGVIMHYIKDKEVNAYHDQVTFITYVNKFSSENFNEALDFLTLKHSILRSIFSFYDDTVLHIVQKKICPDVEFFDIQHHNPKEQQEFIESVMKEDRERGFDILTPEPLWRIKNFILNPEYLCLLWISHHAIIDGYSTHILISELKDVYAQLQNTGYYSKTIILPTYKDFVVEELKSKRDEEKLKFWKEELENYNKIDFGTFAPQRKGLRSKDIYSESTTINLLRIKSKEYNISVKTILFTSYLLTLRTISYHSKFMAGIISHGRPAIKDGEKIIGNFLNIVPINFGISNGITWRESLTEVNNYLMRISDYTKVPYAEIVRKLNVRQRGDEIPVNTFFNFIDFSHIFNVATEAKLSNDDIEITTDIHNTFTFDNKDLHFFSTDTDTDVNFLIALTPGNFLLNITYYESDTAVSLIEKLAIYYFKILGFILNNPNKKLSSFQVLTEDEKKELLFELNSTRNNFPKDKYILHYFKDNIVRNRDKVAVKFYDKHLTYNELDKISNRVAWILASKGVKKNEIVGVLQERSLESIINTFAILKLNAIYSPLDVYSSTSRVKMLLADSNARYIIIDDRFVNQFKDICTEILISNEDPISDQPISFEEEIYNSQAYLMYTSGTSGKPKGVLINHQSLINRLNWMQREYPINSNDIILQKTLITFDVSVWELFWWCISSASLSIISNRYDKDSIAIFKKIEDDHISIIHFVPFFLNEFVIDIKNRGNDFFFKNVRYIFVSGEVLGNHLVEQVNGVIKPGRKTKLVNLYGPTECTIDVTHFDCSKFNHSYVPIGRPIDNVEILILDKEGCLLPKGVTGELAVSGVCNSDGYLNNPTHTAEKFVFSYDLLKLTYRTGDLGYWNDEGLLCFRGRNDSEIKKKGIRINTREIKNAILSYLGITNCIIETFYKNGYNNIVALYQSELKINVEELTDHLAKLLPFFYIPDHLIQLEKVSVSSNGKLNLDRIIKDNMPCKVTYISQEPRTPMEKQVAEIFKKVVKIKEIGISDNFFNCGADSIKLLVFYYKLIDALDIDFSINILFQYTNIFRLSGYLEEERKKKSCTAVHCNDNL